MWCYFSNVHAVLEYQQTRLRFCVSLIRMAYTKRKMKLDYQSSRGFWEVIG
jgi:hypothetical protein